VTIRDLQNLPLTGAETASLEHYTRALHQFRCYIEDPVASVDAAIAQAPDFVMAHILKAYLHLLGTEPEAMPVARECLATARRYVANDRERAHIAAINALTEGRWHDAGRALEDVTIENPRDILALQAGHLVDFFTGNARMLRDRIARVMPAWDESVPGYHNVLAMHAFGLEETGDYANAERAGRRGIELEPRDGWAQHAVAHVMEMQSRTYDGIAWMRAAPDVWSKDSFFQVHLWWHLALYHLELGEIDEALKLFDGPIHGARSKIILELIDASAILWRLHLRGIDVESRWQSVAELWAPVATAANYAFNDVHAVMAFIGAGRHDLVDAVLRSQQAAMACGDDNATFTREVGHTVTLALRAFGRGDYSQTVRRLRAVREIAHRFGGSHAQRDLMDLTLLEASIRSGEMALARALCAERSYYRPESPLTRLLQQRSQKLRVAA